MRYRVTRLAVCLAVLGGVLGACSGSGLGQLGFAAIPAPAATRPASESPAPAVLAYAPGPRDDVNGLIRHYSAVYRVPESLVHSVVKRESGYNAGARNGPYWGLMQINPQTARTMGYRGEPAGLLDADTNLRYAVKYLAGAYLVADGDPVRADLLYRRGYYYDAKRKGLLEATGLR